MRKSISLSFAVAVVVSSLSANAQTSYKQLFQPVSVSDSATLSLPGVDTFTPGSTTPDDAKLFASTSVFLSCPADGSGTALLSGDNGTGPNVGQSLIVDNFISVLTNLSTEQYIPADRSQLFSAQNVYPSANLISGGYLNGPVWTPVGTPAYSPVADQPFNVTPGDSVYTIRLMDWGYTYGSSAVWLKTTCVVHDKVCHHDKGAKGDKTLTVDPNGYAAHLAQHSDDYSGACTDGH
jgi:hypothetical protein